MTETRIGPGSAVMPRKRIRFRGFSWRTSPGLHREVCLFAPQVLPCEALFIPMANTEIMDLKPVTQTFFRTSPFARLDCARFSGCGAPALVAGHAVSPACRPFILPSPVQVAVRFWKALVDGSLLDHTLHHAHGGPARPAGRDGRCGGAGLCHCQESRLFERLVAPYLVATQAIPIVAIAPLLVIWFGPGIFSKVLICALIVFFPVLVNTVVGVRAVPQATARPDALAARHAPTDPALSRTSRRPAGPAGRAAHRGDAIRHRGGGRRTGRLGPRAGFPGQRGAADSTTRPWSSWQSLP